MAKRISENTTFTDGIVQIILDCCSERPLITESAWEHKPITLKDCVDMAVQHTNEHDMVGLKVYKTSIPAITVYHQGEHSGGVYLRDYFDTSRQYWKQIGVIEGYMDY